MTRSLKQTIKMLLWIILLAAGGSVRGEIITVGFVSFDLLIPGGSGVPGVNAFSIGSFTGSNSLAPDFPVINDISFLNSSLMLVGDFTGTVNIGTVVPGSVTPASLEFPDTTAFLSATFSTTLSQTTFTLFDGRTLTASQSMISAQLLPSAGVTLTAGTDLVVLTVEAYDATVPEPSYGLVVSITLLICFVTRSRRAT